MKRSSYFILIGFALIVGAVWWWLQRPVPTALPIEATAENQPQRIDSAKPTEEADPPESQVFADQPTADTAGSDTANSNCLSLSGLSFEDQHPIMIDEAERLAPILVIGPQAEAYRNQTSEQLESLALGGDSLAMAVLGAAEIVKAFGDGTSDAVDWLKGSGGRGMRDRDAHTAQQIDALDRAAYWLHESALHGRLSALHGYSQVISARFGDAGELGWISDEQLELFPSLRRRAGPRRIYTALMFELEPELQKGVIGAAIGKEITQREPGEEN
ncbi:MAG: hypothetical protein AAF385_07400, partial [Pseudomonadota bacterium]